ncbi:MAG TPA: DUF3035 domain-containing protein [Caulobacteraceae bacterium]|jgi:hypothetical protein|nr:DUF3035 domain-containing protein [Caulobacteraceae bacterium]
MSYKRVATAAVVMVGLGLAGCDSTKQALGMTKVVPDEFRVVTKAPLVVPPDYALRPPSPGEPRPQELQPESQARVALMGQREAEQRSDGEKLLVAKAGADKADPLIRYVVDDEFGEVAHKDPGFADRVMFWKKDKAQAAATPSTVTAQQAGADTAAPVDPKIEAQRVAKLTANREIIIKREPVDKRIKLPGL